MKRLQLLNQSANTKVNIKYVEDISENLSEKLAIDLAKYLYECHSSYVVSKLFKMLELDAYEIWRKMEKIVKDNS